MIPMELLADDMEQNVQKTVSGCLLRHEMTKMGFQWFIQLFSHEHEQIKLR